MSNANLFSSFVLINIISPELSGGAGQYSIFLIKEGQFVKIKKGGPKKIEEVGVNYIYFLETITYRINWLLK